MGWDITRASSGIVDPLWHPRCPGCRLPAKTERRTEMEARKSYKSFEFKISICWQRAFRGLMTRAGHQEVAIVSPPEFKGDPDVWCPEELLIGSVSTCLMLTFLSYSERRKLTVLGYESEAVGIVENLDGKYRITRARIGDRPFQSQRWRAPLRADLPPEFLPSIPR